MVPHARGLRVLLAGALLVLVWTGSAAAQIPAASEVEMRDQRGGSGSVAAFRGEPVVVMVVTASRLRNLKAWQRDLQERFEGLRCVLVADIPAEPPATFERVREKLEQRVPEEVAVLIDLERRWATELDLDTARPNLLLLDRDGRLTAIFRGLKDAVLFERVSAAIAALTGG